jgi:hypothetical protein
MRLHIIGLVVCLRTRAFCVVLCSTRWSGYDYESDHQCRTFECLPVMIKPQISNFCFVNWSLPHTKFSLPHACTSAAAVTSGAKSETAKRPRRKKTIWRWRPKLFLELKLLFYLNCECPQNSRTKPKQCQGWEKISGKFSRNLLPSVWMNSLRSYRERKGCSASNATKLNHNYSKVWTGCCAKYKARKFNLSRLEVMQFVHWTWRIGVLYL